MKTFAPLILLAASLAACSTTPKPADGDAESARLLAGAIGRAESASPATASADAKAAPAQMASGNVTVSFVGDAKDLLKQMAAARSLNYQVYGPQPRLPLFVIVDVKGVTFEQFLTDVGSQFGQRADLVLTNESIEVRYRDQ